MLLVIQILSYLVGIPLQVMTIGVLLRGAWRQFPLVFAYVIGSFLATVTEMPQQFVYVRGNKAVARAMTKLYYINEGILQILILAVVLGFIYSATAKLRSRHLILLGMLAGASLFAGISFFLHFDQSLSFAMSVTLWARDLKLCSTLLDLALWAMLINSKHKDRLLLTLTGAMGIMFTGQAIGGSILSMASANQRAISLIGRTIYVMADNLFLYIWWQAFRRLPVAPKQSA